MLQLFEARPDLRAAHVFADHLEATLDLAEELELLYLIPTEAERAPGRDVLPGLDRIGAFVERIETIELAIAAKLELARAAALRIAKADERLSTFTRLFHSGTQPLVDLWPELADPGHRIFESGHDPLTFLQARGVLDESRSTLEGQRFLGTGAEYLLIGTVKLGAFLELCDTCLKALDQHYHIYEADADWEINRAGTIEVLRERRDEAIRVALGALPRAIEAPIEMVASDAVDEAIELIEGLTFPEEKRFAPEPAPVEALEVLADDMPCALADEAVIEERPYALGPIEAMPEAIAEAVPAVASEPEAPVAVAAIAVVEIADAGEAAAAETTTAAGEAVDRAASKPGLFAPVTAARRSLATILAGWNVAVPPVAVVAEATAVPMPELVEPVSEAAVDADPAEVVVATMEIVAVDTGPASVEAGPQLTVARQRLVDLIAERVVIETAEVARVAGGELPARAEPLAADIITEEVPPIDAAEVVEEPVTAEAPTEPGASEVTATECAVAAQPALPAESEPSDGAPSEPAGDAGVPPVRDEALAPGEGLASLDAEAAIATTEPPSDAPAPPVTPRPKRPHRKRRSRKS